MPNGIIEEQNAAKYIYPTIIAYLSEIVKSGFSYSSYASD